MELTKLSIDEKECLKAVMSIKAGCPSELPDRVEDAKNIRLADKLRSLSYGDLDHLFMQVYDLLE